MEKISVRETLHRLNIDIEIYARYTRMGDVTIRKWVSSFLTPSIQSLFLYRLSRFFFVRGWPNIGRFFYTLNLILYGADIGMISEIEGGIYLPHPVGVGLYGKIGSNVLISHHVSLGGGMPSAADIGAGPGLPVVESDVYLGVNSVVLGPVRIGRGSLIAAYAFVTKSVPEHSMVKGIPAKNTRKLAHGELEMLTSLPLVQESDK